MNQHHAWICFVTHLNIISIIKLQVVNHDGVGRYLSNHSSYRITSTWNVKDKLGHITLHAVRHMHIYFSLVPSLLEALKNLYYRIHRNFQMAKFSKAGCQQFQKYYF